MREKFTNNTIKKINFQRHPVLDPDAIAKSLQSELSLAHSDIEAGKQVLRQADDLIRNSQSFTVEITLSGSTYLRMALRAQEAGFIVVVFFVGTVSVEINLQRVEARVQKGGHDVPEEDQRRQFPRTLANMKKLLSIVDMAVLFDNSTSQGHLLVRVGHPAFMHWIDPLPAWVEEIR